MSLYLKQIEVGPMQNFMYLVGDREAKKCWLVDPAWDMGEVLAEAEKDGMAIEGALVTHAHFDHCNSLEQLLKLKNMPVYVNKREPEIAKMAAETGIFGVLPADNLKLMDGGDTLQMGGTRLTFLHTPGHTPGSQCFLVDGRLISGDTLFMGSCGRCDLPGGSPYELYDSLNNVIGKLPESTILLPGHNYSKEGVSSDLGREKKANRFFQNGSLEEFLNSLGF